MNILFLGASGMVGAGALREALAAADVEAVLSIVRAMLRFVQGRTDRFILESADINRVGA